MTARKFYPVQRISFVLVLLLISLPNFAQQQIIVDPSGGGNYTTIQSALASVNGSALSSDLEVLIRAGEYDENLSLENINSSGYKLTIRSESGNPSDVVLKNSGTVLFEGSILNLTDVSNISIENLTFLASKENSEYLIGLGENINGLTFSGNIFTTANEEVQVYVFYEIISYSGRELPLRNISVTGNEFRDVHLFFAYSVEYENFRFEKNYLELKVRRNSGANNLWANMQGLVVADNVFMGMGMGNFRNCSNVEIYRNKVTTDTGGMQMTSNLSPEISSYKVYNNFFIVDEFGILYTADQVQAEIVNNNFLVQGKYSAGAISITAITTNQENSKLLIYNNIFAGNDDDVNGIEFSTGTDLIGSFEMDIDYNNYFFPDESQSWFVNYEEQESKSLDQVRTLYNFENHGMFIDPLYTSEDDLHAANGGLKDKGKPITYVTTDIDGNDREGVIDIGASEIRGSVGIVPVSINEILGNLQGGKTILFRYEVRNSGSLDLNASWIDAVYLSSDVEYDDNDRKLSEVENTLSVSAGDTYTGDMSIDLPPDIPGGSYHLILKVNDEDLVFDEKLSDNFLASELLVFQDANLPNLQVSDVVTPVTHFSGKRFELKWTVTNNGEGSTPDIWQDYIFVANDPEALQDPDILNSDSLLAGRVGAPVALNPGESYEQVFSADIPLRYSGKIYYRIQADATARITETNADFSDNGLISDVINITQSPLPDLVVNKFNTPATAFSGERVAVNWEVENVGQQSTYRTSIQRTEEEWLDRVNYNYWYDVVYISRKPYFDTEEESQREIGRYYHPDEELEAGYTYSVNDSVSFDRCDYGLYYIFVVTNDDYFTYELDEQNNRSAIDSIELIIDPMPDLLPLELDVSGPVVSGKEISIKYTIRNDGFSDKDDRRVLDYFYISRTDTFNIDSSIYLGYESVFEPLAQNASYSRNVRFQLPFDVYGNYNLFLKTDFMDNICEVQGESNNTLKQLINIELADQPDLVPSLGDLPDTLIAGKSYSVKFRVENSGEAGAVEDSWYDLLILDDEILSKKAFSDSLGRGGSYQRKTYFTVPFDMPQGMTAIQLKTDSDNSLFEYGGEDNNVAEINIYIKRDPSAVPDLSAESAEILNVDLTAGDTLVLNYRVSNRSLTTPVNGWSDRIILTDNSGKEIWTKLVDHFGNVAEGSDFEGQHRVKLPYNLAGNYMLKLEVNAKNNPLEYNRENNIAAVSADIEAYIPPDIETDLVNYSNCCNMYALQEDSLSITIRNNGPGDLVDMPFTLVVKLSEDEAGTNAKKILIHRQEFTIAEGAEASLILPVKFMAFLSGNYYTVVNLDIYDEIFEGKNESNNRYISPYTVHIDNEPIQFEPVSLTINSQTSPALDSYLSLSYSVNKGTDKELRRYIEDQIILSKDRKYDNEDYRFANPEPVYRNLSAGEPFYEDELSGVLRSFMKPGWYYVGVKTDVRNNVLELDETNNVIFSADSFYLDLTIPLTLDQPYSGSFYEGTVNGQEVFHVDRPAGSGMFVKLNFSDDQAASELYHRVGEIPTSSEFDNRYRDPFLADQELVVPVTDTATEDYVRLIANRIPWVNNSPLDFECWLRMTGSSMNVINSSGECILPDPVTYEILAESAEFSILRSYPDSASYHGVSNILIEGFDFDESTTFFLVNNGDSIHARRIELLSGTEAMAVFDFRENEGGRYDLVAKKSTGQSTRLDGYFTVFEGTAPAPWVSINHSSRLVITGRKFYVNVDFGNHAYMNGYDYWLLIAVSNESGKPELLKTSYIGSSSEEIYEQLSFDANPTGDSTFVDIDGIRYYAYWIPVLPPRSQTTFTYIIQSSTPEFVLTQARIYEQPLSNFQMEQDINYLDQSVTLNKIMDAVFEESAGFEPNSFSSKKSGGGFDCSNIDMRQIEKQIANDVKQVAENVHGGYKTYKGATSIEEVVEIAIREKKKEFTDAINVPENLKESHKAMAKEQLKAMVKKEKGTIESISDYAQRVFDDADPVTQVQDVLETDEVPFEELLNNTFSCIDPGNITKEAKRCYMRIRDHNGNYKYTSTGAPGCGNGGGGGSDGTDNVNSKDPNAIVGPTGETDLHFIRKGEKLKYTIQFENIATADAPARFVSINNELPEGLRPQSFVITEFGFGDTIIRVEPSNRINRQVELGEDYNFMSLDLVAGLDVVNNRAFWRFSTINPETGNLTTDPFSGFLPPNDSTGIGEGYVSYEIYLEPEVEGGAQIDNQAEIIFDQNEIIPTNVWSNIIVSSSPQSKVNALPETSPRTFTLSWSGSAGEKSAGIKAYDIYVSRDDQPFRLLLDNTLAGAAEFEGEHGSVYSFYSVLTTIDGERETVPVEADAITRVDTTMVFVRESLLPAGEGSIISRIYPNPASDWLKIDYKSDEEVRLMLYDVRGRLLMNDVLKKAVNEESVTLDLRDYDQGILVLQLVNSKERKVYRVIRLGK